MFCFISEFTDLKFDQIISSFNTVCGHTHTHTPIKKKATEKRNITYVFENTNQNAEVELIKCTDSYNDLSAMTCQYTTNFADRSDTSYHVGDCKNEAGYENLVNPAGWGVFCF